MNSPRQLLVREIQLAFMLGFTDVEPFRRAIKAGQVPQPSEYLGGRPVWYLGDLERRYGSGAFEMPDVGEKDVLQAIDGL